MEFILGWFHLLILVEGLSYLSFFLNMAKPKTLGKAQTLLVTLNLCNFQEGRNVTFSSSPSGCVKTLHRKRNLFIGNIFFDQLKYLPYCFLTFQTQNLPTCVMLISNHVLRLCYIYLFYNVSRMNKGERGLQRTQWYFTLQVHLRQQAGLSRLVLNATFSPGIECHKWFLRRLCPFNLVIPLLNKAVSFLPPHFWLLHHHSLLSTHENLYLDYIFQNIYLRVSFTDCFAALQMAQHFVDERA